MYGPAGDSAMIQDKLSARRALLAQHVLFADLRPDELERVLALTVERTFPHGQTIFQRGDQGSSLMAVLEGRVRISVCSEEGKEVTLGIMGPGELLGEIALLDGKGRTADATAMGACRLLLLDQRVFLPFLERNPSFAVHLLQILCGRLRKATSVCESLALLDIPARLARLLVQLAELQGEPTGAGRRIGFRLSQQELGNLVAATRESVNKQLKLWEDEGLISVDQGRITLHDLEEMRLMGEIDG
jgi:CRP/FNR family transcriptional regulator, cyclic AMP receptor protein